MSRAGRLTIPLEWNSVRPTPEQVARRLAETAARLDRPVVGTSSIKAARNRRGSTVFRMTVTLGAGRP